jgi:hypothetical protein
MSSLSTTDEFSFQIKSIFNNPQTLKEVFGDFVNLINQTSNVATTSENKQCVQKTDMNSKMNDMNNNETVLSSESGSFHLYNFRFCCFLATWFAF